MDVSGGNFTTTTLVTEGELATDPINGNANDQPYIVKPCEDPDSRFRIEEAEILIRSLNERRLEVDKKIAERRVCGITIWNYYNDTKSVVDLSTKMLTILKNGS
jgi:hypothetical protein